MIVDFNEITPSERYFAMVQSIIPRPIAWVLSDNGVGKGSDRYNLAPFSFFTGICSDPPLLMFSAGKKAVGDEAGRVKDTVFNIQQRKDFVVHIAAADSVKEVNDSAATLNHGDSEIAHQKLALADFEGASLPRLADSKLAMACSLYRLDTIGHAPQNIIYGQIKKMYVAQELLVDNEQGRLKISSKNLDPLARLGGSDYCQLGEHFQASRPK